MKKQTRVFPMIRQRKFNQILIKIRLLFLVLFVTNFGSYTFANAQDMIVNIKFNNISLDKALNRIQKEYGYNFVFNNEDVEHYKISGEFKNTRLKDLLKNILGGLPLGYKYENNLIFIYYKKLNDNIKNKLVKGVVKDKNGNILPGVSVLIKGTIIGTTTNNDGEFSISIPEKVGTILRISFIGMKAIEQVVVFNGKTINIVLLADTKLLEDVVVTGYQVINKRESTSSIVSVKGEDVIEPITTSIDKMLQGKISGMVVINQSSTPGALPKIRIRGSSSITGNREPVWVVDGIILQDPVSLKTSDLNSMDKVNLIGNAISFLNPQDIERIDVLKDASATAIYGTKAANGVIVITTKRGQRGNAKVNYSGTFGFTARPNYNGMDRMNSMERIDVSKEMVAKGLNISGEFPSRVGYEGALMDLYERKITYDEFKSRVSELESNNTDWYKELFRNSFSQNHNVSVSGGSDKTTYYFSLGYNDEKGATMGVNYSMLTARINLITELAKNVKLNVGMSSGFTKNKRNNNIVDLYQYAYNTSRAIKAYNSDGTRNFYANYEGYENYLTGERTEDIKFNIFNEMEHSGNITKNRKSAITMDLDWKINSMFSYKLTTNYSYSNSDHEDWFSAETFKAQRLRGLAYGLPDIEKTDFTSDFYRNNLMPAGGKLSTQEINTMSYTVRNAVKFNRTFDKHSITANVGMEMNSKKTDGRSRIDYGYLPERGKTFIEKDYSIYEDFYEQYLSDTKTKISDTEDRFLSFYGTFSYSYDYRYIFNFNIRADGSNKFGQDESTKFLPIWSLSGRWNIADEHFLDNQNFINQLSLRASYGIQGNVSPDQVASIILQQGSLNKIADEFASTLYKVPNDNLKWEKTTSYNVGLDFALWKNKINGSFEYYYKKGKDQIVSRDISPTNGASTVSLNSGNLKNYGWELTLGATLFDSKDFAWSLSVNTSQNKNKVEDAGALEEITTSWGRVDTYENYLTGDLIEDGRAVNSFYSYQFDKINSEGYPVFKNSEEVDKDGNMLVGSYDEAYKRVFAYSGTRIPDLTGGFTTNIRIRRVSINAQFSFSLGSKLRLNNLYDSYNILPHPQENMSSEFVNRWRTSGDEVNTVIPGLSNNNFAAEYRNRKFRIANDIWEMYNYSDLRVVSGDFLRCRNLSCSYALPEGLTEKMGVKGVNLSFAVSNLFVLKDKALKGKDPEQITMGSGTIPPQKTYSLTVNLTF